MKTSRAGRTILMAGAGGLAVLLLTFMVIRFDPQSMDRYPASLVITDREGGILRMTLGAEEQDCRPVGLERISPWAQAAMIAAEDKRFRRHIGIDPLAIVRAMVGNMAAFRRTSGASTISTQVIKMTEPRPRTLLTKVIEAVKAIKMEAGMSKENILEQHLNRAPFGSYFTGVEAASRHYFGKAAADLNLAEAALLMGLPQSPSRLRPDRHPEAAEKRMSYVLEQMEEAGYITPAQRETALRAIPSVRLQGTPFQAPHFSDLVASLSPGGTKMRSSLDLAIQSKVEHIFAGHAARLKAKGIHGGAVVVLDVERGEIVSLIGSPDYFDLEHAGQVNGAAARRSPGSALKPFIYGLALDQGLITPGTELRDEPTVFREYKPVNFDGEFRGRVSARDALIESLNIPALELAEKVGQDKVLAHLQAAGLRSLDRAPSHYGLSLALGGGEVTLLDLVNAYGAIARGGMYRDYTLRAGGSVSEHRRIMSAEAAYLLSEMLSGDERNMSVFGTIGDGQWPRFAWKTGTSSGFRDAWTIAWNPALVVGVWLGNPDGKPAAGMTGIDDAAPLAADLVRTLSPAGSVGWFVRPEGIREVTSPDGSTDLAIAGISDFWSGRASPALRASGGEVRAIVSPVPGRAYTLLPGHTSSVIPLRVSGAKEDRKLYWFVNDQLVGTSSGHDALPWTAGAGSWSIRCASEEGWSLQATITISEQVTRQGVTAENRVFVR